MRGKRPEVRDAVRKIRITPADAGKTGECGYRHIRHGDHPRGCGENEDGDISRLRDIGSPPQVRGKLYFKFYFASIVRITPAGAGKTLGYHVIRCPQFYHPRRCGENLLLKHSRDGGNGITPAGAGKTIAAANKPQL